MNLPPQQRYQFKPFLGSSHTWAIDLASREPSTSCVLDIGSGSGAIGEELKKRGFKELYAIETDEGARDHATKIYLEAHNSLQAYKGRSFEIILLLDVLEHTTEPEEFLKTCTSLLKPGGLILVSVPNIAHWSIRLLLLFGIFNYHERGILDKTHFRFFTRKTLKKLLCFFPELKITNLSGSIEPLELILPKWAWDNGIFRVLSKFRIFLTQIIPGLFSYQCLAALRRKAE